MLVVSGAAVDDHFRRSDPTHRALVGLNCDDGGLGGAPVRGGDINDVDDGADACLEVTVEAGTA